jgi:hypothetical protein
MSGDAGGHIGMAVSMPRQVSYLLEGCICVRRQLDPKSLR